MNTKVRCKPRNMTDFNQKVKILKTLNFRYDAETNYQNFDGSVLNLQRNEAFMYLCIFYIPCSNTHNTK